MKLQLNSEMEVVTIFRQARNKAKQIKILAETNGCTPEDIVEILREHGVQPNLRTLMAATSVGTYPPGSEDRRVPAEIPKAEPAVSLTEYDVDVLTDMICTFYDAADELEKLFHAACIVSTLKYIFGRAGYEG